MAIDISIPHDARGVAVLLHPHPQYGGSRFHPFLDGLFLRLPGTGVGAVRFDFTSSEPETARAEAVQALDAASEGPAGRPVILTGYSFGSAIAATVDDSRVAAWFLLAPPIALMAGGRIGPDTRPKFVLVPEFDQFSPPDAVREAVDSWASTEVGVAPGCDHFLGDARPVVETALAWIDGALAT